MNKKHSFSYILVGMLLLLALFFGTPIPAFAAGTATINGVIRDNTTNDPLAGATVTVTAGCTTSGPYTTGADGAYSFTVSWTNNGGGTCTLQATAPGYTTQSQNQNINNNQTRTLNFSIRDTQAPVVTITFTPNANGWFNAVANGSVTATDNGSTIETLSCTGTSLTSGLLVGFHTNNASRTLTVSTATQGSRNITCSATDRAGNNSGNVIVVVRIDTVAPTIAFLNRTAANGAGWNNTNVNVNWSCTDATSGPVSATVSQTVTTEGANQSSTGTCADLAGNIASNTQTGINIDKTPPTVTYAVTPDGSGGWFKTNPATGSVSASDALSTVATFTCSGTGVALGTISPALPTANPSGPLTITGQGGITASCTAIDRAGNTSGAVTATVNIDSIAPTITFANRTAPNGAGWNNTAVTVNWNCADPGGSGPVSATVSQTLSTEGAGQSAAATCSDVAGNTSAPNTQSGINIDLTGPTAVLTPSGTLGLNGWYVSDVTITTSGTDSLSTPVTCTGAQSQTADTAGATFNGSCTNAAGLTTDAAPITVKRDTVAPTGINVDADRGSDMNGYYNHSFTATWTGTDATSGIGTCTSIVYNGPDTVSGSLPGSCSDAAGNVSSVSNFIFQYDGTNPVITYVGRNPAPNANGWNSSNVTVDWSCSDPGGSGPVSASVSQTVITEGADQSVTGTCEDNAGNTASDTQGGISIDKSAPSAVLTPAGTAGTNGWFTSNVIISTAGSDISNPVTCTADQIQNSETTGTVFNGSCTNAAGLTTDAAPLSVKVDKSAPTAVLTPTGTLGANGWYTSNVVISTVGSDISNPVVCTADQFQNTDTLGVVFNGSCTNDAGLTTDAAPVTIKRDAVAPSVFATASRVPDFNGWYTSPVTISFSGTDDTSGIAACDSDVIYSGPDSATVTVTGSCTDLAGNSGSGSITFKYAGSGPVVTLVATGTLGTNGWYTSDVTITTSGTDPLGGALTCTGVQTQTTDTTGAIFNGSCTNTAGLTTNAAPLTVKRDTVNPAIAYIGRTAANGLGWNNTNVTANWTCTDATSGPISAAISQTLTTEGVGQSASATCVDNAGNSSPISTVNNINIDKTLPVITLISRSPAADGSGWNYTPVTVTWACSDTLSGVITSPISMTLSTEGAGQVATGTCQDQAGNFSSNTVNNINISLSSIVPPVEPTATDIPPVVLPPTATRVVPPTAVPTETKAPASAAPTATQLAKPTATATEMASIASSGQQPGNNSQVPVTGGENAASTASGLSSRTLLFGLFGLLGLGFLLWLLFFLLGKKRRTEQQ